MSDLPKGYEKAPADYSGQVYLESQMRSVRDALNASLRENESLREQLAARVPDSTYESVCSKIVGRYVVDKRTGGGFWPYCVRAVGGSMELFIGQKNKCDEVAQALQAACLDGAFMMKETAPQPVAQPEQPAVQGEPLFLLHTGDDFGGERGDWDVEANSFRVVEEFCKKHPPNTAIGLFAHPQPERVALTDEQMKNGFERRMLDFGWCNFTGSMQGDPICWYYEDDGLNARWIGWREANRAHGMKGAQQ